MRRMNNDQISALARIAGKNNADINNHNSSTIDGKKVMMQSLPPEVVEQYVNERNGQRNYPASYGPPPWAPPQWNSPQTNWSPPPYPPPMREPQNRPWVDSQPQVPSNIPPPQPQYPEHRLDDNPMFYDMSQFEIEVFKQLKLLSKMVLSMTRSLKVLEEYFTEDKTNTDEESQIGGGGNFSEQSDSGQNDSVSGPENSEDR